MTRVSTSNRYVPGHSLTSPFFRWLRPEAIYLFVGLVSRLGMLLTVQVKVSADCLDVKTHHACSRDNHVVFYMKWETSISCAATIVWCIAFLSWPPMLEGRFMLYVLVYSIAESLGIFTPYDKDSSSAVAYIVSFFCSSYALCDVFHFYRSGICICISFTY